MAGAVRSLSTPITSLPTERHITLLSPYELVQGSAQNQCPEPLLSITFGNSQRTPANLFQKRVTTSLFHQNALQSLHRGRCLRGSETGAALYQVPHGMHKAKAARWVLENHLFHPRHRRDVLDTGVSLSLWWVCVTISRYRGYFEEELSFLDFKPSTSID